MSDSGEGIDAEIDAAIADEVGPRIEARRTQTAARARAGVETAVRQQTAFPDEAFAVYDLDAAGFVGEGFFHQTVFETEQAAREVARGDDDRLVVRVAPLDTEHPQIGRGDDEVTPERCEPLLKITMRIQGDPTDPETRLAIEEQLGDTIGYINRRIFTTAVEGPALNNNFVVFVQLSPAETWTSIDRKVQRLYEWAGGSGFIDDVGRHVAVTLDGGDPELSVRAEPGAV